jgi:hypothetical protein
MVFVTAGSTGSDVGVSPAATCRRIATSGCNFACNAGDVVLGQEHDTGAGGAFVAGGHL